MSSLARDWLRPARPEFPAVVIDPAERRAIKIELAVVLVVTFGLSGLRSLLSLLDLLLRPEPLADQQIAMHRRQAQVEVIDALRQLLGVVQLLGWGALGLYLLWRAGIALRQVGFPWRPARRDVLLGVGLTALIGIPGLALYFVGWKLGVNVALQPSTLDTWWESVALTLSAAANAFAEEVVVVALVLTRLRQLGVGENASLLLSAVLRGSYHLYQGLGGFVGNLVMGLVFGRVWQHTNRLWPLVLAHFLLDFVAFVGYTLLRGTVSWLP